MIVMETMLFMTFVRARPITMTMAILTNGLLSVVMGMSRVESMSGMPVEASVSLLETCSAAATRTTIP